MIACYLELYQEGEVEHIDGPTHPFPFWVRFQRLKCDHAVRYLYGGFMHAQSVSGMHFIELYYQQAVNN